MHREIKRCRVCGNERLVPILNLGRQAVSGTFPLSADKRVPEVPLELVKCHGKNRDGCCNLLQLKHSYIFPKSYWENYGYRSGLNRQMVDHLNDIAARITNFKNLVKGDLILDIGSNDATFLRAFPEKRFILVGIDPAADSFQKYYPGHIKLVPGYFSADKARKVFKKKKAKVVTAIAVFYNLSNPVYFMRQVAEILDDNGVILLEQAYMPAMLRNHSYDAICHEHLEFYGLKQIEWIAKAAGLNIIDAEINDVNGGSILVILAKTGSSFKRDATSIQKLIKYEEKARLDTLDPYSRFRKGVLIHRNKLRSILGVLKSRGKGVIGYGASTKGNVMLQFCGITPRDIPCIAEINRDKFWHYTPGSRIPIIPEEEALALNPDYLLVFPWHFKKTIAKKERAYLNKGGRLLIPLPEIEILRGRRV